MKRLMTLALAGVAAAGLGFAAGMPSAMADQAQLQVSPAAVLMADGAAVFKKKCKKCHGADGKAKTKMGEKHSIPDLTAAKWQGDNDLAAVVKVVTGGKDGTKMKSFKEKLSAEEIDAVAKFVKALK